MEVRMKCILAFIGAILLAVALSACVSVKQHESLSVQHRELRQTLQTKERLLYNAKKDHRTVVRRLDDHNNRLRQQLSETQKQLKLAQDDLKVLRRDYEITSDELSKMVTDSLDLIEEKRQINDTAIKLKGTISTLRDTAKDLQDRLDEATAAPSNLQPGSGVLPSKVPQ